MPSKSLLLAHLQTVKKILKKLKYIKISLVVCKNILYPASPTVSAHLQCWRRGSNQVCNFPTYFLSLCFYFALSLNFPLPLLCPSFFLFPFFQTRASPIPPSTPHLPFLHSPSSSPPSCDDCAWWCGIARAVRDACVNATRVMRKGRESDKYLIKSSDDQGRSARLLRHPCYRHCIRLVCVIAW